MMDPSIKKLLKLTVGHTYKFCGEFIVSCHEIKCREIWWVYTKYDVPYVAS